jgi:hypothetical protein
MFGRCCARGGAVWVLTNRSNKAAMATYEACGLHRPNQDEVMLSLMLDLDHAAVATGRVQDLREAFLFTFGRDDCFDLTSGAVARAPENS